MRRAARVRTVHIALSAAIGWAVVVAWLALAVSAWAASPSPSTGVGGDPRSSGQGPGLVGDPLFALVAVIAIGLGALILTLAYVRLTRRRFD